MKRRDLLKCGLAAGLTLGTVSLGQARDVPNTLPKATYDKLPRWRGFNLLEKFGGQNKRFVEDDFRWIHDFGFNFVRLPMDYRAWILDKDWRKFNEKTLVEIDETVRFGEKYGIHINLNFHRAPGYSVAKPAEAKSVWTDPEALEVCALHWRTFAKRYKGISSDQVSFNLFNEPDRVESYMPQCIAAHEFIIRSVREEDPDRLIICDGYDWGNRPFPQLVDQKVAQANRGYKPMEISHYKASWVDSKNFSEPIWPPSSGRHRESGGKIEPFGDTNRGRAWLKKEMEPWLALQKQGVGVMVGEFGAFSHTPHDVVLRWMEDMLANWKEAGWGYALWNFRGPFGILDSNRADVAYEDFQDHKLDRKMLELLQMY